MKRFNIFVYIIFFLLALMLTSCSDGSSSDNGPVQVSLSLSRSGVSSRIVSVDEAVDLSSFAFYYKATPLWTGSDFAGVVGQTADFVRIDSYRDGKDLGYFAQGKWLFEVEVRLIDQEAAEADWVLFYSGSTELYISTSNYAITIPVVGEGSEDGTVYISVLAPTVSESDSMTITYSGTGSGSVPAGDIEIERTTGDDRWTSFLVDSLALPAGQYTFCLTYNDGTDDVGGATVAVNVNPGMTTSITGTVESGVWQNETVSMTGLHSFGIKLSAAGNKMEVAKNGTLVYTCTKTPGSLDIDSYEWYVNGDLQTGEASSTFTFVASNFDFDYCTVTCVAKTIADGEYFLAYSSLSLILTEGN